MNTPVIELPLHGRSCEACGISNLRKVCEWSHVAVTRTRQWLFRNTITICETCGFTFLSPCYAPADLTQYYSDSYARFGGQALDFSPEKRLAFIDSVLASRQRGPVKGVIEVGGNADTAFQRGLGERFGVVSSYEPNAECGSDFADLGQAPESSYDLLVHYFILEHIADVRGFLRECRRLLRGGGVMILEVPDLMLYPHDISALILHEHCNHFTLENLAHLAALEGFELIDSSSTLCSRSFGFAAAFERLPDGAELPGHVVRCFDRNLAALDAGITRVTRFRELVEVTMDSLRCHPEWKVVLWGANDNLVKALPQGQKLSNAILVDSDPRKIHYHQAFRAILPSEALDALREADKLILFTRLHAPAILDWIEHHAGRRFADAVILDY
ncbi:MAG: class I SAM-dependent methyltransferase [Prosthecobacter sp.]|nr:class I SAM-dependent methyltransferase [Prosthecobacter sp.]